MGCRQACPALFLLRVVLQVVAATSQQVHNYIQVVYHPAAIRNLTEGHNQTVRIDVVIDPALNAPAISGVKLDVLPMHPHLFEVIQYSDVLDGRHRDNSSAKLTYKGNAVIHGKLLGKSAIEVRVSPLWAQSDAEKPFMEQGKDVVSTKSSTDVWVIQDPNKQKYTKVFVVTLIILITIANVLMGCELDTNVVLNTLRKPIAPAIGFCTQYVLMPVLAYLIAVMVLIPRDMNSFALGLFVTGCSPAGGASNFWTLILDGNAHLSITMTFISMISSLVMMPFWMNLLGYKFLRVYGSTIVMKVPYMRIIIALLGLIVPLLVGILIAKKKPDWAANARRVLRPFVIFVLVFVIVVGTFSNLYMFEIMNWPALISGLLLPWCGFMFGCFTAILLRQKPEDVTAIAIETGVHNTGIAIMLLKFSFGEPDADISSLLPVIVACFTPFPLLAGFAVHSLIKYVRNRNQVQNNVSKPADMSLAAGADSSQGLLNRDEKSLTPAQDVA